MKVPLKCVKLWNMFKVNFEKIWHLFLEFLLLTLNKELFSENTAKVRETQNDHCEKKKMSPKKAVTQENKTNGEEI